MASNNLIKFSPRLKELRVHLCQTSASSKGLREFIDKYYFCIKSQNPNFPILIRECSNVSPKIWARYEFGKENYVDVANLNSEDIFKTLVKLNASD